MYFKRIIDFFGSLILLIIFSPIMCVISVAIKLDSTGSIFFTQQRVGKGGVLFRVYKFRSMPVGTAELTSPEAALQGVKITRVGKWMRRLSLDELPQLWNILKGEMSLIGPRPILPRQIDYIALRRQNGSIVCLPCVSGLCQVEAFSSMSTQEKAAWDGCYHQGLTFWMDCKIAIRTIFYLLRVPPED